MEKRPWHLSLSSVKRKVAEKCAEEWFMFQCEILWAAKLLNIPKASLGS